MWPGASGAGTSRTSSVPPSRTLFARTLRPSTVARRPSAISRWMYDRESPVRSATKRSARRTVVPAGTVSRRGPAGGAWMSWTTTWTTSSSIDSSRTSASSTGSSAIASSPHATPGASSSATRTELSETWDQRDGNEQHDRRRDRGVRDVERVPADPADPRVDEVHDVATGEPIDQVPDRATEQQPEGNCRHDPVAGLALVPDDQREHDDRHGREQDRAIAEQSEEGAAVLRVDEAEQIPDDRDALARCQCPDEERFRDLIEDHDDRGEGNEQRPARPRSKSGRRPVVVGRPLRSILGVRPQPAAPARAQHPAPSARRPQRHPAPAAGLRRAAGGPHPDPHVPRREMDGRDSDL